jgi:hypothetical protein
MKKSILIRSIMITLVGINLVVGSLIIHHQKKRQKKRCCLTTGFK